MDHSYKNTQINDADLLHAGIITEAFREPVMLLDMSLCITAWNRMCEAMCGRSADHVLGKPFFALFPLAADNHKIAHAMHQARAGYASFLPAEECEYTPGYFDNHFMPLKNGEGAVIGIIHLRHDIAHRLKAIAELERLNRILARKNAELAQWVSTLQETCKSIKNFLYEPLSKVHEFTNMLLAGEETSLSKNGRNYFERIKLMINKSRSFTASLIAYIMPETEKQEFSEIDLNHIVRFVRNNLQHELSIAGASFEWEFLPVIRGNRRLVYLVFHELVTNAINFRKVNEPLTIMVTAGKVQLEALSEDIPNIASCIWVSVTDNGVGFSEPVSDLLRPFYKAPAHLHTAGNGIGLALCKKIMDQHNGSITAQSIENGSVFTCGFPDYKR